MEDSEQRLRFPCPHCGKRIAAPPNLAGKRLQCPNKECGEVVTVPLAQPLGVQPSKPAHAVTPPVEPSAPIQVQPLEAEATPEPIAKRPGRKKRKQRAASSSSWKIWLLAGGGVAAAVALVVVGLVLWLGGGSRQQATRKPAGEDKPIVADSGKPPAAAPDVKKEPDPAKVKPVPTPPVKAAEPVPTVKPPPPAQPPAATVPPPPAKPPVVAPPEEEKPKLLQEFRLAKDKVIGGTGVSAVAVSKDGKLALSSSGFGALALSAGVSLWNVENGQEARRLDALKTAANSLALSPDGRRALLGCEDGSLRLWDVTKAKELRVIRGDFLSGARSGVFSPDGRLAATGGGDAVDTVVRLWDAATVKALGSFKGHKGAAPALAFSADGRLLLTGGWDSTVRLWDVKTRKQQKLFAGHTRNVHSVAISPDGTRILSGSADKTLRLWDAASGETLQLMHETAGSVNSVAFLDDGAHAISGSGGDIQVELLPTGGVSFKFNVGKTQAVRVWDLKTGRAVCEFPDHGFAVLHVTVLPKSQRVITVTFDGKLRLWQLPGVKK